MTLSNHRRRWGWPTLLSSLVLAMVTTPLAARAGVVDEVWVGGFAHDFIDIGRGKESGTEDVQLEVDSARPHQGRYLVRFSDVASIEDAEGLRGAVLLAEPIEDSEALLVHELIGAEVIDQFGTVHGHITGVEANPAADLLVVDGKTYVPSNFVTEHAPGRVVVDVPEGLFE